MNTSLQHLVLEDSYVIGILVEPYRVALMMDFVLTPEHPRYSSPSPDENECYRRGTLRIADFGLITWRASNLRPSVDATGEQDYGFLDKLVFAGGLISLHGDWGEIDVTGGTLTVTLNG